MKLRIALISEHASPLAAVGGVDSGGQNIYVRQLARQLAHLGHSVVVFTRRDDPLLPETICSPDGYRVVHVPAGPAQPIRKEALLPHMAQFSEYVVAHLKQYGADVVHANFFMSGIAAMHAKRCLGVPFVMTFHALGRVRLLHQAATDEFPAERLEIEDSLVAEADAIIAECPQDAIDQTSLYDADPRKMHIIPCGYDPDELWRISKAAARRELGFDRSTPIVLQLGRLVPRKGVDDAIRGFARAVRDANTPARMLVVGGDSERPDPVETPEIGRLMAVAGEEGVASRVTFTGRAHRSQLRFYYSAAAVFVTTPWYEPFGITPLEAMACGTPVVGANVGGIKYTVEHERTGLLVPPHDPDAIGAQLRVLLKQTELAQLYGRQGVRRVRSMFTWAMVADAISALYGQVLDGRPRRRIDRTPRAARTSISSPGPVAALSGH
jgi:glycosyltransferase involved in cell wall biosynthesis